MKMHIFSLCALGSSSCFHPWSNLSIKEKTKTVNTCHSLSACFSGDWCMPVSRCFCLFPLVASLSFLFFYPHGCFSLWACMYGFCNFAALICVPMCLCEFTNLSELQSFTWCTVIGCVIRIIRNLRNSNTKSAKLKCPLNKIFHIPGWTGWGWGKKWGIILFFPL